MPRLDVRRVRAASKRRSHLLGRLDEGIADDFEPDGIYRRLRLQLWNHLDDANRKTMQMIATIRVHTTATRDNLFATKHTHLFTAQNQ